MNTQEHAQEAQEPMESWRAVWRRGVAPLLSTEGLVALRDALATDDERWLQGATTTPPPLLCVQDLPVEAACCLGYCVWQGDGLTTVGEVEEAFAQMCFAIDQAIGEPAGCRWWLNWHDETPRETVRAEMIPEIDRVLAERQATS